jgi:hypothetical protein
MLALVFATCPLGHHNYFHYNGVEYCVALRFLTLFMLFPLFPIGGPILLKHPRRCSRTTECIDMDGCCNKHFWICYLLAWLRLFTLGLSTLCTGHSRAKDPTLLFPDRVTQPTTTPAKPAATAATKRAAPPAKRAASPAKKTAAAPVTCEHEEPLINDAVNDDPPPVVRVQADTDA